MKKIVFLNCDLPECVKSHAHKNFNDNLYVCEVAGVVAFES